jgi:hypothetical protein
VLTVLGYSIYDTIIIFDRIRENITLMKRASFRVDRERVALGDDPAVAGDDVHHARPDRLAASSSAATRCKDFAFALWSGSASVRTRRSSSPRRCSRCSRSASPSRRAATTRRRGPRVESVGGALLGREPEPQPACARRRRVAARRPRRSGRARGRAGGAKRERRRQRRSGRPHGRAR